MVGFICISIFRRYSGEGLWLTIGTTQVELLFQYEVC